MLCFHTQGFPHLQGVTWFLWDAGRSLADSSAFFGVWIIQYLHQSRDSACE